MKKRFLTLILTVIATFTCGFGLVACNQGQGGGSSQSGAGAGEVPVYQGMTISNGQSTVATAKNMSVGLMSAKTPGNTDNNGKHNGWYKGDHNDKDHHVDQENPFPDNESDENIESEMESSLDVIGAGQEIYYATINEDVYINVHINNPDNYEIISFTLNGEKYSSYMFEKGSDMETLILKYNVGDNSGIQEYTIDAIKYIDGTEIKDVVMEGDKTVVAGIRRDDQVTATVSKLSIGFNDVALTVNVADEDKLIEYSQGCLKAVIYDGENIVATKDLVVGDNDVAFDNLGTMALYQYAIVGYYDNLSGEGIALNTLFKEAFYTKAIVLFDNIEVSQEDIQFSFLWDNDFQNKTLTSLTLFKGEEETNLSTIAISADGLLSNTVYSLVAKYENGEKTESISLEFKTESKATPVVEIANVTKTPTSVSFAINETDTDDVGVITNIELVHANGTVVVDSVDVREFTGLLSNNSYTIKVSYTYDLNDGVGLRENFVEFNFKAGSQGLAYRSIEGGWEVCGLGSCQDQDIVVSSVYKGEPVVSIGYDAFQYCSSLKSIEIPDSVTSIGDGAFRSCDSLTSVEIGSSVTSIATYAFRGCYKLVEVVNKSPHITIEKGSTDNGEIGRYALAVYNSGDTFVSKLSSDNGYIIYTEGEEKILVGYMGTETDLTFPSYITKINQFAFDGCRSLTSIEIPDSVKSICNYAFSGCRSLTSIEIPDSVTSIGKSAFFACNSLTSVVIGDGVTSIDYGVFIFCDSLTSVTFEDTSTWYRTSNYTDWQNKMGGTQRDVSYPSNNASHFVNNYNYYWYKL